MAMWLCGYVAMWLCGPFFVFAFFEIASISFLSNFVKMRIGNDKNCTNKIYKILDMNFISIKKHEMEMEQDPYWIS